MTNSAYVRIAGSVLVALSVSTAAIQAWQQPAPTPQPARQELATPETPPDLVDNDTPDFDSQLLRLSEAAWRLPLAAGLAGLMAMRPRRRGKGPRNPSVIQTQIILSIIGALVMLVVGTSLARAFGIVGAAGLVRYRAKVEDNKDAGVMLSTLAIGLAAGVGLYLLAIFGTLFVIAVLWGVESGEPDPTRLLLLKIKTKDPANLKSRIEQLLQRHHATHEVRGVSPDELQFEVQWPLERPTDRVSEAILALGPKGETEVEWEEKNKKK
jgi:uncharacterized membrane protein YhiD involved in acid resistance